MTNETQSPNLQDEMNGGLAAELARYGIASVPTTSFEWGGYRYSNARDAIAAAKRGASA
jgi:hypothetical protein